MNSPLISIIVPVYNTEKYLDQCIQSVLAQTYTNWELLLINDGSTDSSGIICDKYAAEENRIRVIHQKNLGVSAARLKGLKDALGTWIVFLDADDELMPHALSTYHAAIADGIDLIISETSFQGIFKAEEFIQRTLQMKLHLSLWGRMFRKAVVNEAALNIPRAINIGEDFLANIAIGNSMDGYIFCLTDKLYFYRQNPDSVLHLRQHSLEYTKRFLQELEKLLQPNKEVYKDDFNLTKLRHLEALVLNHISIPHDEKWVQELKSWARHKRLTGNQKIVLHVKRPWLCRVFLKMYYKAIKIRKTIQ